MLDYLEKFNNLPPKIKHEISTPEVTTAIAEIGQRYRINLAATIIRIMIKEIDVRNLASYFVNNFALDQARAQHLENELKEKVLAGSINYLYRRDTPLSATPEGVPLTKYEDDYWHNKIEHLVERSGLYLGSDLLNTRLKSILLTYLKHIRDKLATKDALTKPQDLGGLGLDEESANNLLLLADDKIREDEAVEIRPPAKMTLPEDKRSVARDVEYDLAKSLAQKQGKTVITPVSTPATPLAPPPPAVLPVQPTATASQTTPVSQATQPVAPATPVAVKPAAAPQPAAVPKPAPQPINNLRKTEAGKIKMDDIKAAPRVFTPVDELLYMTLKNFRNLDADPWQAIAKIKEKLKVLQSEDYGKMVAGVKAWRLSPVNKMYVSLCQEALRQGKPAQEILQQQLSSGNSLTEQEFEAIIKLNQDLKF